MFTAISGVPPFDANTCVPVPVKVIVSYTFANIDEFSFVKDTLYGIPPDWIPVIVIWFSAKIVSFSSPLPSLNTTLYIAVSPGATASPDGISNMFPLKLIAVGGPNETSFLKN